MPHPQQQQIAIDEGALLAELESSNSYFDSVVNTIPSKLYVAGASGDDAYSAKYMKGQHKESKEARRARNKAAKQSKFDPEGGMETTLEAKRRVRLEEEAMDGSDDDDGDDDADVVMSDGDGEEEEDGGGDGKPGGGEEAPSKDDDGNGESYASRIEALRARLRAKMAAASGGSKGGGDSSAGGAAVDTSAPSLVSKRAARRAEKRKRQEAAKQRANKKKATSVAESKERQRVVSSLGGSTYNDPSKSSKSSSANAVSAADDLATIDYQSLAGLKPKAEGALDNKSLLSGKGGKGKKKSLEKLLEDAERKAAKLRELKGSGNDDDREKAMNMEWGEALKVAG